MEIETKDYGYIAYLILKHKAVRTSNGVTVESAIDKYSLVKEYKESEFSVYNEILKVILKG